MGKWQGAVTQVLAVAASVVIYYPFVKALDRQYQKKKPMKYQKHCRERGVKEMHVENDKNICCEVEKEWKNVSSDGARVGSNLFLYFPTYEEFMAASIDEKIIMFTHVAPTPQQKF